MDQPQTPSTARMIDYWLGGRHHFPIDVAAARAFEGAYGPCAHEFEALRQFLRRVVEYLRAQSIGEFLVFGAGLPTQGNVHEVVPDASVLYTDIDRVNVALGQQILGEPGRVAYTFGDATDLGTIDPSVLARVLPGLGREPTGLVFLGLGAFLDDEGLQRTFEHYYDVVATGSFLAFDFDSTELADHPEALAMMGPSFHMRDPSSFPPLLGPWQLTAEGVRAVAEWGRGEPGTVSSAAFYGGVAAKAGPTT